MSVTALAAASVAEAGATGVQLGGVEVGAAGVAAAACAAAAVLVLATPSGRRPAGGVRRAPTRAGRRPWGRPWGRPWERPAPPGATTASLDAVLLDVAARLRAGAPPAEAWVAVLGPTAGPVGADGVPSRAQLTGAVNPARSPGLVARLRSAAVRRPGADGDAEVEAAVVVAAARLAQGLGAPLAPVLEQVADAVAARADVEGERRAAVAGPRASARLLGRLPLLGVGVGVVLGADPVGTALDGGVGTAAVLLGLALLLAGRRWSAVLLAGAEAAGRAR